MIRKTLSLAFAAAISLAAFATQAAEYSVLGKNEYRIAGHPYKTAIGCKRKKPVGKFDGRCDIPLIGYRGFYDPSTIIQSGGAGGFGGSF